MLEGIDDASGVSGKGISESIFVNFRQIRDSKTRSQPWISCLVLFCPSKMKGRQTKTTGRGRKASSKRSLSHHHHRVFFLDFGCGGSSAFTVSSLARLGGVWDSSSRSNSSFPKAVSLRRPGVVGSKSSALQGRVPELQSVSRCTMEMVINCID